MSNSNKFGLGRGLEALLGDDEINLDGNSSSIDALLNNTVFKSDSRKDLPLEKIEPCSFQPRTEFNEESLQALSESIKEKGVLQPILVREKNEKYEIIAGERRFKAAKLAGFLTIPAIIRNLSDKETLEVALVENIQRENLNAIEEAKGLSRLLNEYRYTQDNLSKIISKSRAYVTNSLRLLALPKNVQDLVYEGKISSGHARALVGLDNAFYLAKIIIEKGLSVRETERLASENKNKHHKNQHIKPLDTQLVNIMKDLEKRLGLQVKISSGKKGSGSVVLKYDNPAQLSRILDILEQR